MSTYQQGPDAGNFPQGQAPVGGPHGQRAGGFVQGQPAAGVAPAGPGGGLARRWSSETKAAFRTTELIAYMVAVVAVLIAAAVVGDDADGRDGFGADRAWLYVTLLTIGYLVSRGLAKSGTRPDQ